MEKTARKPSADPAQERLRQNKANWNKEVSALVNDLIHFKKMMNGWPSKFFKERSRITDPIPADPATIIGSLAGDFQELVNKGNGIIQEQLNYSKTRRRKQPKPAGPTPGPTPTTPEAPAAPEAPKTPDLGQQLGRGLAASAESELIKLAADLEDRYLLEVQASNPISRFITRLFNPKFGFGEAARMRRLRMTMLDSCVKVLKILKVLQAEIMKSSKQSIVNSNKMMLQVSYQWNIVRNIFSSYKLLRPGDVKETGGKIEDPELKREKDAEEGRDPDESQEPTVFSTPRTEILSMIQDYNTNGNAIGTITKNPSFGAFVSDMERFRALPKGKKPTDKMFDDLRVAYVSAVNNTNQELGTQGKSFQEILQQYQKLPQKQAQEFQGSLGKIRHQLIPGATSGSRLEIYKMIIQIRRDLDDVMDLLESGFDQEKLTLAITQVSREIFALRTLMRALHGSEKPEEATSPYLF